MGRIRSQAAIYQIIPSASYVVTERLSLGISPVITLAQISADPFFLGAPNDANGDGFFTYGPGSSTRGIWGGGFQLGAYYITDNFWHLGVSYKSPQWMEPLRVFSQDELGRPTLAKTTFNLPAVVSLGVAYSGFERFTFATDVRYFDYANADGFRQHGFNPNGSAAGLGWNSIVSVAQGIEFKATERLALRLGYSFNENPITNGQSQFNVASPLIVQHLLSMGFSFNLTEKVVANLAYTHGFQNHVTGPFVTPLGAIPGTSVTSRISSDMVNAGVTVRY